MSTFGREADYAWFLKRYRQTQEAKYLLLAQETKTWLGHSEQARRQQERLRELADD
jgi:hypothetical protein